MSRIDLPQSRERGTKDGVEIFARIIVESRRHNFDDIDSCILLSCNSDLKHICRHGGIRGRRGCAIRNLRTVSTPFEDVGTGRTLILSNTDSRDLDVARSSEPISAGTVGSRNIIEGIGAEIDGSRKDQSFGARGCGRWISVVIETIQLNLARAILNG